MATLKAQLGPEHHEGKDQAPESGVQVGAWQITEDAVLRYARAVGDSQELYVHSRLAPPLALIAWSLGGMLQTLDLPPGAIHSIQEMETLRGVGFGERVTAFAQLGQPRRRGDLEFTTAAFTMKAGGKRSGGEEVLRGESTILVNRDSATPLQRPKSRDSSPADQELRSAAPPTDLPVVEQTITQDRINDYAEASGDYNPLHLDPVFAATTQFGEVIAHGMLTLALVSQAMGRTYGNAWLDSGALKVRFKGAAYIGDRLFTRCQPLKRDSVGEKIRDVCSVGVWERTSGRELVSGSASVIIGNGVPGQKSEDSGS